MAWHRWDGTDLILSLKVQPRSARDGFAEVLGHAIKLRLTAQPVDGKANEQLVMWLATQFGVTKSAILIESGKASRLKRVRIKSPENIPIVLTDVST